MEENGEKSEEGEKLVITEVKDADSRGDTETHTAPAVTQWAVKCERYHIKT